MKKRIKKRQGRNRHMDNSWSTNENKRTFFVSIVLNFNRQLTVCHQLHKKILERNRKLTKNRNKSATVEIRNPEPYIVGHSCNSSTWEVETGHQVFNVTLNRRKSSTSLNYRKPSLTNTTKQNKKKYKDFAENGSNN